MFILNLKFGLVVVDYDKSLYINLSVRKIEKVGLKKENYEF